MNERKTPNDPKTILIKDLEIGQVALGEDQHLWIKVRGPHQDVSFLNLHSHTLYLSQDFNQKYEGKLVEAEIVYKLI